MFRHETNDGHNAHNINSNYSVTSRVMISLMLLLKVMEHENGLRSRSRRKRVRRKTRKNTFLSRKKAQGLRNKGSFWDKCL